MLFTFNFSSELRCLRQGRHVDISPILEMGKLSHREVRRLPRATQPRSDRAGSILVIESRSDALSAVPPHSREDARIWVSAGPGQSLESVGSPCPRLSKQRALKGKRLMTLWPLTDFGEKIEDTLLRFKVLPFQHFSFI